jgi:uncharacterized membrane protein
MSNPISPAPAAYGAPDDKTMVLVVYVLYLLGFLTGGVTTVIGLVMAYVLRGGAGLLGQTHYTLLIRTFWALIWWMVATGVLFAIGVVLSVVLIGIPLLFVASVLFTVALIWYAVRCIVGLISAMQDQPYGRPRAWII